MDCETHRSRPIVDDDKCIIITYAKAIINIYILITINLRLNNYSLSKNTFNSSSFDVFFSPPFIL